MEQIVANGWTADWLVGWLASIGLTYRDREIKLSWTDEPVPCAVFHVTSVEQLEAAVPTIAEVEQLAITRHLVERHELPRKPTSEQYADRSRLSRETGDLTLGATLSDIGVEVGKDLPHSPFDPPVPKGLTVAERLLALTPKLEENGLPLSFDGAGRTAVSNGLGFDLRRLAANSVPGRRAADAHAETLAFFGSVLFTQCGRGTRGWKEESIFRTGAFQWATWHRPLDWAGIDSFLDHFYAKTRNGASLVPRVFESVAYRPTGSADPTRGYDGQPAATPW